MSLFSMSDLADSMKYAVINNKETLKEESGNIIFPSDELESFSPKNNGEGSVGSPQHNWNAVYAKKYYDEQGNEIASHLAKQVNSEIGAHNIRHTNGNLQFFNGENWVTIETKGKIVQHNEFDATAGQVIDIAVKETQDFIFPAVEVLKFEEGASSQINNTSVPIDNETHEIDINAVSAGNGSLAMKDSVELSFTSGGTIGDFVENTSEVFDVTEYADVIGMEYEER